MNRLTLIAAMFVAGCCGSSNETEAAPDCLAYCGSLDDLNGRCALAFGDDYGVARECGPADNSGTCESLSALSPGLVSDCTEPGRSIFCCPE